MVLASGLSSTSGLLVEVGVGVISEFELGGEDVPVSVVGGEDVPGSEVGGKDVPGSEVGGGAVIYTHGAAVGQNS